MPPLPHRIRRLTFRVKATSQEEALALRKELRDHMEPTLLATFEHSFDEIAAKDEIIHIPRLELRLKISGVKDIAAGLPEQIQLELRGQLSSMLAGAARMSLSNPRGPGAAGPSARSDPAGTAVGPPPIGAWGARDVRQAAGAEAHAGIGAALPAALGGDASVGSASEATPFAILRMSIQYLDTGSLPWPLANLDPATVLLQLRSAASDDPAAVLDQLPPEPGDHREQAALWFRWLQLVPEARWALIARAVDARFSGGQSAPLAEIVAALSGQQAASISRYARLQLAAAAVAAVRMGVDALDAVELASMILRTLDDGSEQGAEGSRVAGEESGHPAEGVDAGERRVGGPEALGGSLERRVRAAAQLTLRLPEPARAAFRGWLAAGSRVGDALSLSSSDSLGSLTGKPSEPGRAAPARVPRSAEQPALPGGQSRARSDHVAPTRRDDAAPSRSASARERERDTEPFGQAVSHAGLLLLHPYLPRFFESTGVKEAGKAELTPARLPRAAALLHLLATGEEEAFELELGFIKIVVGLKLESQLPISEGLLSTGDREEVDALLSAVIEHWSALKRTSVRGLRGSFLQRRGLVREDPQGFRLQVEPAPFDMLLGQLPWGIGVIKLPWMKKAIFTDWPVP